MPPGSDWPCAEPWSVAEPRREADPEGADPAATIVRKGARTAPRACATTPYPTRAEATCWETSPFGRAGRSRIWPTSSPTRPRSRRGA